jgi:voltage-gated potassium channel
MTAEAGSHRAGIGRWAVLLALMPTIPAFYAQLLGAGPARWTDLAYGAAAAVVAARLLANRFRPWLWDGLLAAGLLLAALLPDSGGSVPALVLRGAVALLALGRMVWEFRHSVTRGSLVYLMASALAVLVLCGVGFWILEPQTPTFASGLWLAFTTAATVGYGDVVPSTTASRIFSVFVVLLGLGVLTLTTAAIASAWVESDERRIEREILHDLHRQIAALRREIAQLRESGATAPAGAETAAEAPPPRPPDPATHPPPGA